MQNAAFEELGMNYVYIPFRVKPEYLDMAVNGFRALNVVGVNVTLPHKKSVLHLMNDVSKEAELIGAVNTMVFKNGMIEGYNTDARGFIASLKDEGLDSLDGMSVVVLGAGGAAQAIVVALAMEGAKRIIIANRTVDKAIALAGSSSKKLNLPVEGISLEDPILEKCISESSLLVSTVTAGMDTGFQLPISTDWFHKELTICDIVYTPPETNLLKSAAAKGLRTVSGIGMLLHQGAISFELWTGIHPPLEVMRRALVRALSSVKS